MNNKHYVVALACALLAVPSWAGEGGECAKSVKVAAAEKAAKPADKAPAEAHPEMHTAKPGPEHKLLNDMAGTWDATVEMTGPDGKTETSQGVETAKVLGGLWIVSDFKSEMMQQPFEGHYVGGYDTAKKKYVGTWVDTMTTGIVHSEGTYDPAQKTLTETMEGPGMDGKTVKWKAVTEWKDADTRVFSMYDEGKETASMKITYKRRK